MRWFVSVVLAAMPVLAQENVYRFSVDQDRLSGAADFSFLNRPLGPADRILVHQGHFARVGADQVPNSADDRQVRFFGVNMAFGANFPTPEDAPRIARRLRRLGVNLVRLHHMDSSPDRDPEDCRSILTTGPYPTLNPVAVTRLRGFLNALKAEGIYVNLNLHVGYQFRASVDRVPTMPDGGPLPIQSKPLHIFYPRMIDLQVEFTRKVVRALRLKDDPVLAMVEIDNESSLLEAWQRGALDRAAAGEYEAELERQWNAFLRNKYPGGENGWVRLVTAKNNVSHQRLDDFLLFLAGRDRAYLRQMLAAVREATDSLLPVAGTQMGYGGLLNLDSHQDLDYQDNHFYIDHYNFPNQRWDARDWRIRDASGVGSGLATFLNMAAAREMGRPYTVSEFNQPWPNRQAAEIDPALAVFGAFQNWDSIMHFAYEHGRTWDRNLPAGFNIDGDWTKFPGLGQAAWLFRSGAIQSGRNPVTIPVSLDTRLQAAREKRLGNIATGLSATGGYDPAIALVHPVGLALQEDRLLPAGVKAPLSPPYRSDTGELCYDPSQKLFTIQAPEAAGLIGFLGNQKKASAGAIDVELGPSARGFATIVVTSLDHKPIRGSDRLLLTTPGYTLGTQPGTDPARPQKLIPYPGTKDWWTLEPDARYPGKPSGNRDAGIGPVWMERVESFVTLRTSANMLAVYPLDGAGGRLRPLPASAVRRVGGGFLIHLQAAGQDFAPWYELIAN